MPLRPANQPPTEADLYCVILGFLSQKSARNCYNNRSPDRIAELGEDGARSKMIANYGAARVEKADFISGLAMDTEGLVDEPAVADRRVKLAVVDTVAEKMAAPATAGQLFGGRLGLHTLHNPNGTWNFVGSVPVDLMYEYEGGGKLSEADAKEIVESLTPGMEAKRLHVVTRTWPTEEAALAAAREEGA